MGMSATQGRLLMLTSRKSDLELQAQFINQRIIQLSQKTVRFTEDYTALISNKKLVVASGDDTDMTWVDFAKNPTKLTDAGYNVFSGTVPINPKENGFKSGTDDKGDPVYYTNQQVQQLFQSGAWRLEDANGDEIHYGSDYGSVIREVLDESDDAAATATYETNMAKIQAAEKVLELQLKNIETEHKAIDTEIDAVKKVLHKNIERSFKTFAG